MSYDVKNLNGTAGKSPSPYASWLEFWEAKARKKASYCSNMSCNHKAELGGHVKKAGSFDGNHYIVPLCSACNKIPSDQTFTVNEVLVPAS